MIIYRFDRQPLEGVIDPGTYLLETGVEFITREGTLYRVDYQVVKAMCFIAESAKPNLFDEDNIFERRPKVAGLWTRFSFRDGQQLDGVLPHNLLDWPNAGYLVVPPKAGAARQRVFLPREALTSTELRGVIGRAALLRSLPRKSAEHPADGQLSMFDSNPVSGTR